MKVTVVCDNVKPFVLCTPSDGVEKIEWLPQSGKVRLTNASGGMMAEINIPVGRDLISISLEN